MTEEAVVAPTAPIESVSTTPATSAEATPLTSDSSITTSTEVIPQLPEATPPAESAELSLLSPESPASEIPATNEVQESEVSQSDEPAPPPAYEPFTFPEDIKVDDERLGDFTKTLADFEIATKASHEEVQKLGQQLVDRHISDMRVALQKQAEAIVQQVNQKKAEWVNEFKNDPEFGGNRLNTSIAEANEFIRTHGGSSEQINAFYSALKETGMEAHPAMVRFLLNVKNSSGFRAPQQLAATKPISQPVSKIAKRYGNRN